MASQRVRQATAVVTVSLLCAACEAAELLPVVSVHLEAARYAPAEPELQWTGWIGAGAALVEVAGISAYFTADVESILGNQRRLFEANQANYHLELGLQRRLGKLQVGPFFHHVSRHRVDRDKPEAVDWNVLGMRASGRLASGVRFVASAGHTTLASLVGYRWEVVAELDADLTAPTYARGLVRAVTARSSPQFPRGDFADVRLETGARWRRQARVIDLFAAFERRNDVFVVVPGARNRLLIGFRIRYETE